MSRTIDTEIVQDAMGMFHSVPMTDLERFTAAAMLEQLAKCTNAPEYLHLLAVGGHKPHSVALAALLKLSESWQEKGTP